MTMREYFGDWAKVIDLAEVEKITKRLIGSREAVCPKVKDIFRAFTLCSLHDLKVVIIGQEPYNDCFQGTPRATGIAFGNSSATPKESYSPSLDVLMESVIDFTKPHERVIFDPSLENWEKQGVLLLNAALSCALGKNGVHSLLWRPFMTSLLTNLSNYDSGMVYVLMGTEAQSLEHFINPRYNHIIKVGHPSWYARNRQKMPHDLWQKINDILIAHYGYGIEWYNEYKLINEQKEDEEVFYAGE